jgi:hypothetical protein
MPNYKIPSEILEKIPDYFWAAFAGELVSINGPEIFNADPEFGRVLSYCTGTCGWNWAIKMTCQKLDMIWLYEYYRKLEWWESDMFDGEFEDLLVVNFVEADRERLSAYYKWLVNKED